MITQFVLEKNPFYKIKKGDIICRQGACPIEISRGKGFNRFIAVPDGPFCGFVVNQDINGYEINQIRPYIRSFLKRRKKFEVWRKLNPLVLNKFYSTPLPLP